MMGHARGGDKFKAFSERVEGLDAQIAKSRESQTTALRRREWPFA